MSKSKSSLVPILGVAVATSVIAALYMYKQKQKQAKDEKPEDDLPPNLDTTSVGTGAGEEAAFITTAKGLAEEPKENGNPLAKMWSNFKDKSDRNLEGEDPVPAVEENKTEEQEKKPFWAKIIPPKKEDETKKEEEEAVAPPTPKRQSIWEALIPQKAAEEGIQEATAEEEEEKPKEEEPKKLFGFALGKKASVPAEEEANDETKEENKGEASPTSKRRFLGFELPLSPQKMAQSPTAEDLTLTESSDDGEPAFDNPSEKPKFMGWFGKKDEDKDAKPEEEDKAAESKETEGKPSSGRNIFGWKQQPADAETKKESDAKEDEKNTASENGEAAPKKFWENWKSPKAGEEPAAQEGKDKADKEGEDKSDKEGKEVEKSLKANNDLNRKPRQQSFLQAFINTDGLN